MVWVDPRPRPFDGLEHEGSLHDGPSLPPMASNLRQILAAARSSGIESFLDGHDGDSAFGVSAGLTHALVRRGNVNAARSWVRWARRQTGMSWGRALRRYWLPALVDFAPSVRRAWRRRWPRAEPTPPWAVGGLLERLSRPQWHDWWTWQGRTVEGPLTAALEHIERLALDEGVAGSHPLSDPDLMDFLVRLPPEVRFASGWPKAIVRAGCRGLPSRVRFREDKTRFDASFLEGVDVRNVLHMVRRTPRRLEWIDWGRLEERLDAGVDIPLPEWMLLGRILAADRLVTE